MLKRLAIMGGIGLWAACAGVAAAPVDSVSDLASSLASMRDGCATQAQQAAESSASANYQATLDMRLAQTKAQSDAQVYEVGHGSRETRDFLLNAMEAANQASTTQTQRIADKFNADTQAVKACVARAEDDGKATYSAFKADKRHKRDMAAAEGLMSAWLANVEEVSTDTPQGSADSLAAWKSAKAHIEVSSL